MASDLCLDFEGQWFLLASIVVMLSFLFRGVCAGV